MDVRKRKVVRQGVQQYTLTSEGTPVHLARCFYGVAVRRDHDPGSFMGERKVEEFVGPTSTIYLLGQYSPPWGFSSLVYPAPDDCPGSQNPCPMVRNFIQFQMRGHPGIVGAPVKRENQVTEQPKKIYKMWP